MSAPRDSLKPDERRAADAVRQLGSPHPDPDFRARLKREFVEGAVALPGPALRAVTAAPAGHRPVWKMLLLPMAAGLLAVAGLVINRGPGWRVEVTGTGSIEVNGRAVPLAETQALDRAIASGARMSVPPGVSLVLEAGQMAVEVTPETEASLSAPPGRWLGRMAKAELANGEIRVTTREAFHGARLTVRTPEAAVEVTGTTLAVIREPHGTCVCVMEGEVRVAAQGEAMVPVGPGRRRFIFHDGRPPEQAEMLPIEKVELGKMRQHHRADH